MAKRPEITEQTRANLVNAFWILLKEKKLDKITVKDITDRAGYYRSTFYEYFTDINDLVNQAEDEIIERGIRQAKRSLADMAPEKFVNLSIEFYNQNAEHLSLLMGEGGDAAFASKLKDHLRPIVSEHFDSGHHRAEHEYIIEYVLSALYGTLLYWFQREQDLSPEELTGLITPVIRENLARLSHHK